MTLSNKLKPMQQLIRRTQRSSQARSIFSSFFILFTLLSVSFFAGCQPAEPKPIKELSGPTMGTQWVISLGTGNVSAPPLEHVQQAVEGELQRINQLMSTWDPNSELSQFNATLSTQATPLHPHTITVLKAALAVSEATSGSYDVTRGNVFALWGFSADEPKPKAPSSSAINRALKNSGWKNIQLENDQVTKLLPTLTLDLSSLAKGFAVDQVGQLLRENDIHHYVVNIGGEIESRGERSENSPWRIGIEQPNESQTTESGLLVNDANLATSGSYRNVRIVQGKRVSHLIDGRTGLPITHTLVAATVLHESTLLADAWSTAFMVTGEQWAKSYAVANALAVQLTMLEISSGTYAVWKSPKWQKLQVISSD